MRKTSIFEHFGQKGPILDSFWPKWTKRDFFFKKVSEKSNERIPRKRIADKRTDGWTNGQTRAKFKVLTNSSTNQLGDKSSINPYFEPFEAQNDLFLTIFGQNQANLRMVRNQKFKLQLY